MTGMHHSAAAQRHVLSQYGARLGLALPVAAAPDGLEAVQRAHRQALGFTNIDVMLGNAITIESAPVADKLLARSRGGYCFEHNQLFGQALGIMGLANRALLGRVWIGATADAQNPPPRTHTLRLVDMGGAPWIADAGFGAAYVPPMPLAHGAMAHTADGAQYRLTEIAPLGAANGQWLLERLGPASATDGRAPNATGWQPQYSFDLAEVAPSDLALSNHWASTAPATRFTSGVLASIVLEDGFASLNGRRLTMHHAGRGDVLEVACEADWRAVLADLFHIQLSADEVARLGLF
jgi:arylamine N-acetyltransferase